MTQRAFGAKREAAIAASANVARFPERNKGRKRKSNQMGSMGLLSMMLAARDGEDVGHNVERLDGLGHSLPTASPELLFATLIWNVLSCDQQDTIRRVLRHKAFGSDPNPEAVMLHNMLEGRR